MDPIVFDDNAHKMQYAIAASFDLSGFSNFCRRPDAHAFLPRFLTAVFKDGLRDFFKDTSKLVQVSRPDFSKFTGDGALMLWVRDSGDEFSEAFCTSVVAALRKFQCELPRHVVAWEQQWRIANLPKAARIGIASGPIHPLASPSVTMFSEVVDYVGYCVNLAVRLQDHCPALGFLVHSPLNPRLEGLIKLQAMGMKGTLDEPVYAFADDYERLRACDQDEATTKFSAS